MPVDMMMQQNNMSMQQQDGHMDQQHQEKERSEVHHSSYMHTQIKLPYMNLAHPYMTTSPMAQELLGEGFRARIQCFSGSNERVQSEDFPELDEEARLDYEAKTKEHEVLAKQLEKEIESRTEKYRKQQEVESDKIRRELEKQHMKDVEFRKEVMEMAIENQKRQIDMEARYAKKELERERNKARMTLDQSRFHTDIQVNMESSVGSNQAGGHVVSESEKMTDSYKKQVRT